MKLAYLKSENFKAIEKIEIEFIGQDGKEHSAILSGKNESGKSSVIDAILSTLTDLGSIKEPVKQGKDTATNEVHILIDKDQVINDNITLQKGTVLVCERKYTKDGKNILKVSTIQGTKFSKPKELLNAILGLTVIRDPMELMSMKPREQQNFVMDMLHIDTGEIDQNLNVITQTIYDKGIEKAAAEKAIPVQMPADVPMPEMDADAIDAGIFEHEKYEKEVQWIETKITTQRAGIISTDSSIKETEQDLVRITAKLESLKKSKVEKEQMIETLDKSKPEAPKKSKDDLKDARAKIQEYQDYSRQIKSINDDKANLKAVKDEISQAQEKKSALKSARQAMLSHNLPVKGLTFGEDGLLLNGLSITPDQLSESQQYILWMDILFALNPNLKLIWFKAAHSFDTERKAEVLRKIADHGYIGILEQVSDDQKIQVQLIENPPVTNE